jgi:hypothetical protein
MNIQHYFSARPAPHFDGLEGLFEVVDPLGGRVASCTDEAAAEELEMALNMALTDWSEGNSDRVVAV